MPIDAAELDRRAAQAEMRAKEALDEAAMLPEDSQEQKELLHQAEIHQENARRSRRLRAEISTPSGD